MNPTKGPGVDSDPGVGDLGGDVEGEARVRANTVTVATEGRGGANAYTDLEIAAAKKALTKKPKR